ncbi:MAG: TonB-dependent receptor plug domain-containing protein [Gammaproteobacteria bacterium]|nr:TonB-dependent receptor plug domain-containing protein [Gammaproteobacteria bacterium]
MGLKFLGCRLAVAVLVFAFPALGQDADTGEEETVEDETAAAAIEGMDDVEVMTVTGSRLSEGDATAFVYSLSADDFAASGVSSVEELMRTLPWTYASITQQTSALDSSALAPSDVDKNPRNVDNPLTGLILFETITGFGTSTANLRALGSANTLVLINGRRVAGRAGDEEGFANLLNVPLSAIERVDVQLDGGSAVYGADAIGGVINFITRKNYTGAAVTLRQDLSSTDAHRTNASIQGGYGWGSGQLTGTLERTSQDPITNTKTGWTTNDNRDLFGPEFDDRDTTRGQPGVLRRLCAYSWGAWPCGNNLQRDTAARAPRSMSSRRMWLPSTTCRRRMGRTPAILR